jgi:hypothetical protein
MPRVRLLKPEVPGDRFRLDLSQQFVSEFQLLFPHLAGGG